MPLHIHTCQIIHACTVLHSTEHATKTSESDHLAPWHYTDATGVQLVQDKVIAQTLNRRLMNEESKEKDVLTWDNKSLIK